MISLRISLRILPALKKPQIDLGLYLERGTAQRLPSSFFATIVK